MVWNKRFHYAALIRGVLVVLLRYVIGQKRDICLYRILGNDLPPRHENGQTKANMQFMLREEPRCLGAKKKWVINHVVDSNEEAEILAILRSAGESYIHLPIDLSTVAELVSSIGDYISVYDLDKPEVRKLLSYVTNLNQARNMCIDDGISQGANWVLPLDGSCVFDTLGWWLFLIGASLDRFRDVLMIPMCRIRSNKEYSRFSRNTRVHSEPQVAVFGSESSSRFDDSALYARDSKVELIRRVLRAKPSKVNVSAFYAGYVIRLSSGDTTVHEDGAVMQKVREESVVNFINSIIRRVKEDQKEPK